MGRTQGAKVKDRIPKVKSDARGTKITFGDDDDEVEGDFMAEEEPVKQSKSTKGTSAGKEKSSKSGAKEKPTKGKKRKAEIAPADDSDDNNDNDNENENDDNNDAPEEISAKNDEIIKLREWHENLITSAGKLKKKSKNVNEKKNKSDATVSANKALDASILEALAGLDQQEDDDDEEGGEEEEGEGDEDEEGESENELDQYGNRRRESRKVDKKIDRMAMKSKKIGDIEVAVLNDVVNPIKMYNVSDSAKKFTQQVSSAQPRVLYTLYASQRRTGPAKKFKR